MFETCSLDVAEKGGLTLEDIGRILGLTRERVRQIENVALQKMLAGVEGLGVTRTDIVEMLAAIPDRDHVEMYATLSIVIQVPPPGSNGALTRDVVVSTGDAGNADDEPDNTSYGYKPRGPSG